MPLDPRAAEAVRNAQRYFVEAAPRRTADEEESLVPRLKAAAAARGMDCDAIKRLGGDHERADRLHGRAEGLLGAWLSHGWLSPERFAEPGSLIADLRELYCEHIHIEGAEVLPLAGSLLSASQLSAVGSETRARRGLSAQG